jgi:Tfp pilus assembly protein PilO
MKASDKGIVFGVLVVGLAIAFYLMVIGPKRDKASELNDQISQLQGQISQQQQVVAFGESARKDFPKYYGRLVVLGKAVPAQSDTASMLVQLSSVSSNAHVDFRSIALNAQASGEGSATPPPPATPPAGTSTTPSTSGGAVSAANNTAATVSSAPGADTTLVPATENSAAAQPIGAVVGTAGLPTLPYSVDLHGTFFDIANFIGGIDGLVTPKKGGAEVSPDGRLVTIDGFALQGGLPGSNPKLNATFALTTYVSPADQGLTAGASPSAPAAPSTTEAQPASAVVSK